MPFAAAVATCLTGALLLAQPMAAEAAPARPARVVAGYSGEQLANARVIVAVAADRHLPLPAAVLGVAAAMGESSLRNLPYGDNAINPDGTVADSIGLFQQQHWWGSRAERMTPSHAAGAFFAHLVRVRGWRAMTPTAAIHAVQGNADRRYYTRFVPGAISVVAYLVQHPGASLASTGSSKHGAGGTAPSSKPDSGAKLSIDQLFPANGGIDLSGLAADVAAADGGIDLKGLSADVAAASAGTDWSTTDWATEWDLGSADDAISDAFTDGLGSAGGTIPDVTAPVP